MSKQFHLVIEAGANVTDEQAERAMRGVSRQLCKNHGLRLVSIGTEIIEVHRLQVGRLPNLPGTGPQANVKPAGEGRGG